MLRALGLARELHAGVTNWKSLAHLLHQSPQTIWNWRKRRLPIGAIVLMADKIGCSVEALRQSGGQEHGEQEEITEESMTPEETALIAHYRRADQEQRSALFRIVAGLSRPPAPPQTGGRVVQLKQKRK